MLSTVNENDEDTLKDNCTTSDEDYNSRLLHNSLTPSQNYINYNIRYNPQEVSNSVEIIRNSLNNQSYTNTNNSNLNTNINANNNSSNNRSKAENYNNNKQENI